MKKIMKQVSAIFLSIAMVVCISFGSAGVIIPKVLAAGTGYTRDDPDNGWADLYYTLYEQSNGKWSDHVSLNNVGYSEPGGSLMKGDINTGDFVAQGYDDVGGANYYWGDYMRFSTTWLNSLPNGTTSVYVCGPTIDSKYLYEEGVRWMVGIRIHITATSHKLTYNVTGAPSGFTAYNSSVYCNSSVSLPSTSFSGYTFSGWHASGISLSSSATSFTMPNNDVTLSGSFTKANYNVNYVVDGTIPSGYTTPSNLSGKHIGDAMTAPAVSSYPGYSFSGWTSPDVTIASDGTYTMPAKNITLTGTFSKVALQSDCSFTGDTPPNASDLLNTANSTFGGTHYVGETVTVPANPSADGYIFEGWKYNGNPVAAGSEITVEDNINLVGNWVKDTSNKDYWWKATYHANDTTLNPVSGTAPTDDNYYSASEPNALNDDGKDDYVTLQSTTMTRPGYTFVGWTKGSAIDPLTAEETAPDNVILVGAKDKISGYTDYYAVWRVNPGDGAYWWKVTYYPNDTATNSIEGEVPTDGHNYEAAEVNHNSSTGYDDMVTLKDKGTMSRKGYTFVGWTKDVPIGPLDQLATTPSTVIVPGNTSKIVGDTKYYAVWRINHNDTDYWWKVTYHKNDTPENQVVGSVPTDDWYYSAGEPNTLNLSGVDDYVTLQNTTMTRAGYDFVGWTKGSAISPLNPSDPTPDTVIPSGNKDHITGYTDYYAVWRINYGDSDYWWNVTYDANDSSTNPISGDLPTDDYNYSAGEVNNANTSGVDDYVTLKDKGTMTRAGYTFAGWTKDTAILPLEPLATLPINVLTSGMKSQIDSDTTYYAVWRINYDDSDYWWNVTYHANDTITNKISGEVPTDAHNYEAAEEKSGTLSGHDDYVTLKDKGTMARTGYDFIGWTKGSAIEPLTPEEATPNDVILAGHDNQITGDTDYYAVWRINYGASDYWWDVTYDGNGDSDSPVGGTIPTDTHKYSAGEPASTLSGHDDYVTIADKGNMTRPGYIFEGWTKDSGIDPLNPLDNTPSDMIFAGEQKQITGSTTYYAVWRINYNDSNYWWKVTYDKNGVDATGDVPEDEHYYSVKGTPDDNVVTVKDKNTLYNHKYKFIGWSKQAQNPVAIDADLDSLGFDLYNVDGTNKDVTISANTTLYAVWQEASLGIKDDSDTVVLSYDQAKDAVLTGGDSDKSIDKIDNVSAWTDESGTLNENAPYEALENKLGTSSDEYMEEIHQLGTDKKDGTVYIRYGMTEDNDYKEDVRVIVSRSAHPVYNDDYTIDSADEVTLHANEVPNANIDLVSAGQAQAWTNDGNNTPTEVTVKDNALLSDTVGDYTITYVVTADPTLTKDTVFHVIKADADGDGVPDTVESGDGTNSDDSDSYKDTDGDEVPDYVETNDDHTNPDDANSYKDTDGDEVPDYVEEHNDNTNPSDDNSYKDTDGDGVPDYVETHQDNTDPKDNNSYKDTDGDEVPDYVEEHKDNTDPKDNNSYKDTDGDEVPDYIENKEGSDPKDKSDYKDTDGDGVPDYVERKEGTDPKDKNSWKDTDKGGVSDYAERMRGSNVNDPSDDFPSITVTKITKVRTGGKVKTGDVNNIGLDGLLLLVGLGGIVTALTYKRKKDNKAK